jgi:hypothetical protein
MASGRIGRIHSSSDWCVRMGRLRVPGNGDLRHVGGLLWFGAGFFGLHRGLHRLGYLVVDRGTPGAVNTWLPGCIFYGIATITPRIVSGIMRDPSYKIATIVVQPRNCAAERPCLFGPEPQGYKPARNIFGNLRAWPKTLRDFAFGKAPYFGHFRVPLQAGRSRSFSAITNRHHITLRRTLRSAPTPRGSSTASTSVGFASTPRRAAVTRSDNRTDWLRSVRTCESDS